MGTDGYEFGNFYDNVAAYERLVAALRQGVEHPPKVCEGLRALRAHIEQTEDIKSVVHLLPLLNEAIDSLALLVA